MNTLEAARLYYERGLVVLRLEALTKECVIKGWQKLDRETLFGMLGDGCNIGLRLDGVVVEDFEIPELWPAIHPDVSPEELARHTWVSRTGGGGFHVFARGRAKPIKIDDWIELRSGTGQYVAAPPSIHPETGRPYVWLSDVGSVGIIEASPSAIDLLSRKIRVLGEAKKFIESILDVWT